MVAKARPPGEVVVAGLCCRLGVLRGSACPVRGWLPAVPWPLNKKVETWGMEWVEGTTQVVPEAVRVATTRRKGWQRPRSSFWTTSPRGCNEWTSRRRRRFVTHMAASLRYAVVWRVSPWRPVGGRMTAEVRQGRGIGCGAFSYWCLLVFQFFSCSYTDAVHVRWCVLRIFLCALVAWLALCHRLAALIVRPSGCE